MQINDPQDHNHHCLSRGEDTDMFLALMSQPDARSPSPLTSFSVGVLSLPFKQTSDKPEQDAPVLRECWGGLST